MSKVEGFPGVDAGCSSDGGFWGWVKKKKCQGSEAIESAIGHASYFVVDKITDGLGYAVGAADKVFEFGSNVAGKWG